MIAYMSEDDPWRTEFYVAPDGERFGFTLNSTLVQLPIGILDELIEEAELVPTDPPGAESALAVGPHSLSRPVVLSHHEHSWRMTSATHNGQQVYQCRVCESTAIEGAKS